MTDLIQPSRENEFTPGPWNFDTDELGTWINCDHEAAPIAKIGLSINHNKIANARLIAAAPEMFEILQTLVEHSKTNKEAPLIKAASVLLNKILQL